MLPHPARPAEPAEGGQTPAAKRDDSGRSNRNGSSSKLDSTTRGTASTGKPAFVPPLAPSPPPGTPPTVHTRMFPAGNSLSLSILAGGAEQEPEEHQPGSFGSILQGETTGENTKDSSRRAYHLRGPFNLAGAAQRLVSIRAAQGDDRSEDEQHEAELQESEHPAPGHPQDDGRANEEILPVEDRHEASEYPGEDVLPQDRNLHEHEQHHAREHSQADTVRRIAVTVCTAAALWAAYGLTRTAEGWPQINNSPGSVLDPSASLLGAYAWIWLAWVPVLAGAAVYAAWQWLPIERSNPRQAWTGPVSAGSAVLVALWLWAVHAGNPAAAFWLAALGTGLGLTAIHLSNTWRAETRAETATADLPAAVFLGTSTIALLAGLGSWLTGMDADVAGWGPEAWALIAIVATVIGITTVAMTDRGHLAAALTVVAGLTAIGFARLFTEGSSAPAAAGAFIGAFLILVSAGSRRHQVDHAQRRRQREWLRAEASVPAAGEAPEAVRT